MIKPGKALPSTSLTTSQRDKPFRHGSPWKTQEVDWCHMLTTPGVRVVQNAANSMGNGWLRFYFRLVDDRNMTNQTRRLASRIVIVYCTCSDVARILSFFVIRQVPGEYVYIRIYIYTSHIISLDIKMTSYAFISHHIMTPLTRILSCQRSSTLN